MCSPASGSLLEEALLKPLVILGLSDNRQKGFASLPDLIEFLPRGIKGNVIAHGGTSLWVTCGET